MLRLFVSNLWTAATSTLLAVLIDTEHTQKGLFSPCLLEFLNIYLNNFILDGSLCILNKILLKCHFQYRDQMPFFSFTNVILFLFRKESTLKSLLEPDFPSAF